MVKDSVFCPAGLLPSQCVLMCVCARLYIIYTCAAKLNWNQDTIKTNSTYSSILIREPLKVEVSHWNIMRLSESLKCFHVWSRFESERRTKGGGKKNQQKRVMLRHDLWRGSQWPASVVSSPSEVKWDPRWCCKVLKTNWFTARSRENLPRRWIL